MKGIMQLFKRLFAATWHIPGWGKFFIVIVIIAACVAGKGSGSTGFHAADTMAGFKNGGSWILILIIIACIVVLVKSCGVDY